MIKTTVEGAGGKYLGIQELPPGSKMENMVVYNTPEDTTMMIPISEVAPRRITKDIAAKRKQFKEGKSMKYRNIKFTCTAIRWFDRINGNTYHSVRITRCSDGSQLVGGFQYGYDDTYRETALKIMFDKKWLPKRYYSLVSVSLPHVPVYPWRSYEKENNYPIIWNVSDGLKRECVANGTA